MTLPPEAVTPRPTSPPGLPWVRVFPVRSPTLPPATHTNVYVVGRGRVAIVDPGCASKAEQDELAAFAGQLVDDGERIERILLTHHHVDHVSGAAPLAARLGVPVAAHPDTARLVSGGIEIRELLDPGQVLDYGPSGLRCLATPGHAPGHVCLRALDDSAMLVGDMVATVGTIVIEPEDEGDMAAYLASLARLRDLGQSVLLPAHGAPIVDGQACLSFYIRHRLEREERVLRALAVAPREIDALLPAAYPDVDPSIYPLARRSLLSHLIKLEHDGLAVHEPGGWRLARVYSPS